MEALLLPLVTAVVGGLIGGIVTHYFAARRDVATKRREIILNNLLEALDDLDRSNAFRPDADLKRMERFVYRIYVFGDKELVQATSKFVDEFVATNKADSTHLMVALRNRVRQQLKLSPLPGGLRYLTILPDTKSKTLTNTEGPEPK